MRVSTANHCRFVHAHHNLEDVAIFPGLRAAYPALGPVVDKLEADHRTVSDQLNEAAVEQAGPRRDSRAARDDYSLNTYMTNGSASEPRVS
jgi:hypothetical protein